VSKKPTELNQLKLRLQESLRRKLEKSAAKNGCSMNSEILDRLYRSYEPKGLDLFASLQSSMTAAIESGADPDVILLSITRPLTDAIAQLLPELHSVEIKLVHEQGLASATSLSPKGLLFEKAKGGTS
jgi:hypothetical protein